MGKIPKVRLTKNCSTCLNLIVGEGMDDRCDLTDFDFHECLYLTGFSTNSLICSEYQGSEFHQDMEMSVHMDFTKSSAGDTVIFSKDLRDD